MVMMRYLTRFDGQHKQCLVCSGILEAKCTLIGCAINRTIEKTKANKSERERERERGEKKIFNWTEENENKCVCVRMCVNDNRV